MITNVKTALIYALLFALFAPDLRYLLRAQQGSSESRAPFLEQKGCPLQGLKSNGSVLLLKSVSKQRIVMFRAVGVIRHGAKYEAILDFEPEEPTVEPEDYTTLGGGFDYTPLNVCRSSGGSLAISDVAFADGTKWKSKMTSKQVRALGLP